MSGSAVQMCQRITKAFLQGEDSTTDTYGALKAGREAGCFVDIWRNSLVDNPVVDSKCGSGKESNTSRCLGKSSLMVTSWNCRGLSNSLPYIGALIDSGSSILVLLEHWLRPYELEKLSEIIVEYEALGKADKRLTENAVGGRGCGGIGMLWRKDIGAIAISAITSDRICSIRFTVDDTDGSVVSVIGVLLAMSRPCREWTTSESI